MNAPSGTPYFDAVITLQGWWIASSTGLATLHAIALALLGAMVCAWGRHPGRRVLAACGVVTVAGVALAYTMALRPHDIPIGWITVLHQTLGEQSISHLYMRGVHAGGNFHFVVSSVAESGAPTLHDVVWLNLLLALVNGTAFAYLALRIAGPVWVLPWTLVFVLNPAIFQASFSELPTNLLALYFLAGVIAWAVVEDGLPQPRWARAAGLLLCAILTFFVLLTRLEVAIIGVVAVTVHLAWTGLGPPRWAEATAAMRRAGARLLAMLAEHPGIVVLLAVAGCWFAIGGLPGRLLGRSQVSGLYPFNPFTLALPFFLPMLGLPVGVAIAVVLGAVPAVVDFRRFGGLALSLFMLNGAEFAAETEYYSMVRFLGYLLPAVLFLGLFGRRQLEVLARRWDPGWQRAARVVYVMAWLTLPLPGTLEYFGRPAYDRHAGFSQLLLDRNTQREVRHLLAVTERNPECVFVARVIRVDAAPTEFTEYQYAVFGKPIAAPWFVPEGSTSLDEVVATYARGASCIRLYYGGDCNLTMTDRCEEFVAGRRLVEEERFWSRPYQNPLQFGYAAPEVVLATYAWP